MPDKATILTELSTMEKVIKELLSFKGKAEIAKRFRSSIDFIQLHAVSKRNLNLIYQERVSEYKRALRLAQARQDEKEREKRKRQQKKRRSYAI